MVYVTGDIHGELRRFGERSIRKLKKDDILIICGDFGFIWNSSEEEKRALKSLSRRRYTILFVDGTHENFAKLEEYETEEWNGGKVQRIAKNILHLMRGQLYRIGNSTFFTFGGGVSDDKTIRREHNMWWAQELPSLEEMSEGVEELNKHGRAVDYIITHEPPGKIKAMVGHPENKITSLDIYFNEIMKQIRYKCWYSGSLHMDKKIIAKHQVLYREVMPLEPLD